MEPETPQSIPSPAGHNETSRHEHETSRHEHETSGRERFAAAYGVLEDAIAAHAFPGCAFGVLAGGNVLLEGALGTFTYEQNAPLVTPETIYDVASLTKVAATTAAAMLLYQRGLLDLDAPLGELLPGFVVGRAPGSKARFVTLRHLLAHTSGLPGYVEFFKSVSTPPGLLRACLELPLEADPGARAKYSDPGFILLGKALDVLNREHLATWARHEVFKPLGMHSTGFCPPTAARPLIPPTEEDTCLRHRRIQGEVQDENAWLLRGAAGHAGLFSNVPDLLRFAGEILKAGLEMGNASAGSAVSALGAKGVPQGLKPEGLGGLSGTSEVVPFQNPNYATSSSLFDGATLSLFAQRQGPEGSSRALGWDTPSENSSSGSQFSAHSIGHLGYSGCSLWIDLEAGVAVALLTNRTWPDRKSPLIKQVRPAFHDAVRKVL